MKSKEEVEKILNDLKIENDSLYKSFTSEKMQGDENKPFRLSCINEYNRNIEKIKLLENILK